MASRAQTAESRHADLLNLLRVGVIRKSFAACRAKAADQEHAGHLSSKS